MSEEHVEIVRTLLEMFKRREHETPFAFYAEDIEWEYSIAERGEDVVARIDHQRNLGRGSGVWVDQPAYELAFSFEGNRIRRVVYERTQG